MTTPTNDFDLSYYDFHVPPEQIAQQPALDRLSSRLMVVDRAVNSVAHRSFTDLSNILNEGDHVVFNRTRVIPARAFGLRATTGGKVELLFCEPVADDTWLALVKTRGKPEVGETITIDGSNATIELVARHERGQWSVRPSRSPIEFLEDAGIMPLPPYIKRNGTEGETLDRERYQTVFADTPGAVAAPTAGLHFTEDILSKMEQNGVTRSSVTLHVGLGTFTPVEVEDVREHVMHEERYVVPVETAEAVEATRAAGGRVVAVGTTSIRSLESAWEDGRVRAREGRTDLYIHPPMKVRSVDALLTNFHLPKSSLMLLVSAFAGRELIMKAYREALSSGYRFFSYGDAMLIL